MLFRAKRLTRAAMLSSVGMAAAGLYNPSELHAQTVNPAVDVCTGLSLNRSLVTDVIGEVNEPVVTSIQSDFNQLLDLTVNSPLLTVLAPLDMDLAGVLSDAAAGDPLGVQALDADGNLVSPSNCNVQANSLTLESEGGISIGGNTISGLGEDGAAASAADIDAIAFGNGAMADAAATGSIAMGHDAYASAANSVAIGAGSRATRGAASGYAAYGLSAPQDSAGEFSVGTAGAERQITNVAAGSSPTDAANVGQVEAAIETATSLALEYDDDTRAGVTLGGADGTTISNLADGTLSADSTDAVNGSQLYATNQDVASNTVAISNLDDRVTINEGDIAKIDGRVTVNEGDIANLDGRVSVNEGDIVSLDARVTDNSTAITNLSAQVANVPVGYVDDADPSMPSSAATDTVALIGAGGGAVTLTRVADGTLAAGSTDGVNGSQLAATNARVSQNETDIADNRTRIDANRTDIDRNAANISTINNNLAGSTVVAVQYSDPDNPNFSNGGTVTNDVALVGANAAAPVALHNVAAGSASTDAVNLGQMQNSLANAMSASMAYTDARFSELRFDLDDLSQDARAGTAGAMAFAGLPQTMEIGRSMMAGAVAHYRGETAFAFGLSSAVDEEGTVLKVAGSIDSRGHAGVTAGAGFSF